MKLTPNDRVMIVAAHPDDETLAGGGLIQHAMKAGAAGRVLMVTNGDNNPWPQRWLEKRWKIGPEERKRWGSMRGNEALAALKTLGFTGETQFLGFSDQGLTEALLKNDAETMDCLCAALKQWAPTWILLPSPADLHPDHNALHVLLQFALKRAGLAPQQLQYAVHCKRRDLIPQPFSLPLSEAECRRKYEAISCHKSQMILSSKRFLAYARREESFFKPASAEAVVSYHPIREAGIQDGQLHLGIKLPVSRRSLFWLVGETNRGESLRWKVPIPFSSGSLSITDCITGATVGRGDAHVAGRLMRFSIPLGTTATADGLALLYVKYHRPSIFLDPSGWRQVPVAVEG